MPCLGIAVLLVWLKLCGNTVRQVKLDASDSQLVLCIQEDPMSCLSTACKLSVLSRGMSLQQNSSVVIVMISRISEVRSN